MSNLNLSNISSINEEKIIKELKEYKLNDDESSEEFVEFNDDKSLYDELKKDFFELKKNKKNLLKNITNDFKKELNIYYNDLNNDNIENSLLDDKSIKDNTVEENYCNESIFNSKIFWNNSIITQNILNNSDIEKIKNIDKQVEIENNYLNKYDDNNFNKSENNYKEEEELLRCKEINLMEIEEIYSRRLNNQIKEEILQRKKELKNMKQEENYSILLNKYIKQEKIQISMEIQAMKNEEKFSILLNNQIKQENLQISKEIQAMEKEEYLSKILNNQIKQENINMLNEIELMKIEDLNSKMLNDKVNLDPSSNILIKYKKNNEKEIIIKNPKYDNNTINSCNKKNYIKNLKKFKIQKFIKEKIIVEKNNKIINSNKELIVENISENKYNNKDLKVENFSLINIFMKNVYNPNSITNEVDFLSNLNGISSKYLNILNSRYEESDLSQVNKFVQILNLKEANIINDDITEDNEILYLDLMKCKTENFEFLKKLKKLKYLNLSKNKINLIEFILPKSWTSLDLSINNLIDYKFIPENIKILNLSYNKLTEFQTGNYKNLINLNLSFNSISNIDISKNFLLEKIIINSNSLENFNNNANSNLKYINLENNKIKKLEIINSNLEYLNIYNNPIELVKLKCINIHTFKFNNNSNINIISYETNNFNFERNYKSIYLNYLSNYWSKRNLKFKNYLSKDLFDLYCINPVNSIVNLKNFNTILNNIKKWFLAENIQKQRLIKFKFLIKNILLKKQEFKNHYIKNLYKIIKLQNLFRMIPIKIKYYKKIKNSSKFIFYKNNLYKIIKIQNIIKGFIIRKRYKQALKNFKLEKNPVDNIDKFDDLDLIPEEFNMDFKTQIDLIKPKKFKIKTKTKKIKIDSNDSDIFDKMKLQISNSSFSNKNSIISNISTRKEIIKNNKIQRNKKINEIANDWNFKNKETSIALMKKINRDNKLKNKKKNIFKN